MPYKDPEKRRLNNIETRKTWAKRHPDREKANRAAYRARGSSTNGYAPWTDEEEYLVMNFQGTDVELSQEIGRSIMAIQIRRFRIQKRD